MKTNKKFMNLARNDRTLYNNLIIISEGNKRNLTRMINIYEKRPQIVKDVIDTAKQSSVPVSRELRNHIYENDAELHLLSLSPFKSRKNESKYNYNNLKNPRSSS